MNDTPHPHADQHVVDAQTPPGSVYCRRCDVFTGLGGAGVVRAPTDGLPLEGRCWCCGRTEAQILADDAAGVR